MPNRRSHLVKARHNETLLANFSSFPNSTSYHDWIVTYAFYTALHYVDACLARHNIHPKNHSGNRGRNAMVAQYLRSVSSKYLTLYTRSRYARYVPYSERNITAVEVNRLINWVLNIFKTIP